MTFAILANLLLPLIPSLIQGVERLFTIPKAGAVKMDACVGALRSIVDKLVVTGELGANKPPSDEVLRGMIEAVFQQQPEQIQQPPAAAPRSGDRVLVVRCSSWTELV